MSKSVVIIGASHAGAQTCVSLRQGGWAGEITVFGDDPALPYHRPPLSKDFLSGEKDEAEILIRSAAAYAAADIDMRTGVRIAAIDRQSKQVRTDTGDTVPYDKLVLTTGARVRKLPIPGADLGNIFYLRDMADVLSIKAKAETASSAVIIGGGYIGLETAASLRKQGLGVTVLEAMPRILQRVTAPDLSAFYARIHREEGVKIYENTVAVEIKKTGNVLSVLTGDDRSFDADMVIIGIGVIPNMELAETAGLAQTSDPDIYAAGDVTWHYNLIYDTHIRLESVPNATEQAKTVAAHITGKPKPYNSLPWFWSDQFDLKLQIAGLSTGYDEVIIRGDISGGRSFAAYYFAGDRFLAVDAVNAPRDFMFGRVSLTKGVRLDKAKLIDTSVDLKSCVI